MTENENEYRDVIRLDFDGFVAEALRPELIVISYSESVSSSRRHTLDVGSFCYSVRAKYPGRRHQGYAVDLSSLQASRLKLVMPTVELLLNGKRMTALRKYNNIKRFYNWLDSQEECFFFDDVESMKGAYVKYTAYLYHQIFSSGIQGESIGKKSASEYQKAAAFIVAEATGLSIPKVQSIAVKFDEKKRHSPGFNSLDTQEDRVMTFAALVKFVTEAHRVLVLGGELPLVFSSPNDQVFNYFVNSQLVSSKKNDQDSIHSNLWRFNSFPSNQEYGSVIGFSPDLDIKTKQKYTLNNARKRLKEAYNGSRTPLELGLANRAIAAGLLTFIAATGANRNVALELELHTEKVVPSTQGKRYSGTKGRAGDKDVYPEFGLEYSPVFKIIMELRSWLLNGRVSKLVFPYQDSSGSIVRAEPSCIRELQLMFRDVLPKTVWVNPSQWRKGVGSEYIKLTGGDTILTSEKLGNTESVVRASYARPSIEDTAIEMATFLKEVYSSAIRRARTVESVPVTVLADNEFTSVIPVGSCSKPDKSEPALASGFTAFAPVPNCGEPVTCLFCGFYAVHADSTDIRRLLSLKYLLKTSRGSMPNERYVDKFAPLLHRIDEILQDVESVGGIEPALLSVIQAEVELGNLDQFWAIHFNSFITLGMVS